MAVPRAFPTEASPLLLNPDSETSSATLAEDGEGEEELRRVDSNIANQSVGSVRAVLIILSLWALIFLQASNMSGLTTTQSTIAADLDAFKEASWFTSAYLISMSSISPLAGRLAQIFSARNCIFMSSIVFSIGGLVTSQASSFGLFLAGRVVSGVGAAGILTISIILVLELTGKKLRGLFIGLVNTGFTSGVALGAVIAGALLPVIGWRVLFWAQTPLAMMAGTALYFSIPETFVSGPRVVQGLEKETIKQKLAKVDYFGAFTLTLSIVLFLYGVASTEIQWVPILVCPVLLTTFVLNEIYLATIPIIPVSILRSRGVLLTCLAQLGFMASRWMVLFYSPVYAIAVLGWIPAAAGSMLIPTNIGFACGGLMVGWLHIRRSGSFYLSCIIAFALFSVTLFILGQLSTSSSSTLWYFMTTFLNGLCTGAALNYTLAQILHLSTPSTHFIVTGLIATFRGFAGSFGSAIGGGIFARILEGALAEGFKDKGMTGKEELIRKLLGGPALVSSLEGVEKEVAIAGYVVALQGLFTAASGLSILMVFVQAGAGWRSPAEDKPDETSRIEDDMDHED